MSEITPAVSGNPKPQLAEVLRKHEPTTRRVQHPSRGDVLLNKPACKGCDWVGEGFDRDAHPVHVIAVWRDACRIETVEQLDALPEHAIIRDADCDAAQKDDGEWYWCGRELPTTETGVRLPATLLWLPEWQENN